LATTLDASKGPPTTDARGLTHANLPGWFPSWARRVGDLYFSGTTSVFVLFGNVYDLVPVEEGETPRYGGLANFLAEQMFGRWDLLLHYDLGRGLRAFAGSDDKRLKEMVTLATRNIGDLSAVKNDPGAVLEVLDKFVINTIMAPIEKRLSTAIVVEHASYLFPAGDPGRLSYPASRMLVTVLNWAASPHVKQLNLACVLVDEKQIDFSDRLVGNPHVATLEVPLPDEGARAQYIRTSVAADKLDDFSDYDSGELARLTAGIACTDLNVLLRSSMTSGARLDSKVFQDLKKRLLEKQCQGLLEFVQPKWGLDTVVGHDAAKARLREDAQLLQRGQLDSLPMGYLLCGAVGTGKTFIAQCTAGEIGIPCVVLKNFRSKYVGETEGNLERVLSVLRAMGPVMVIVDEADAALGDRDTSGDSGTSSRVFGMIATQMGDTRYRGRILWMLITARPDLLPIDIKRQGRAEVHIPLFYPSDEAEIRDLFVVLARKFGTKLDPEHIPAIPQKGFLSGADIEGMVGRAWRRSLLSGADHVTAEALAEVVGQFMPSTEGLEKELQETAAIIECTDRQFLPHDVSTRLEKAGGRARLQERLTELKRMGL
jgi:AAA+ superfamily predicted ATPase